MRQCKILQAKDIDWPSLVNAGDLVVWSQGCAEPTSLTGGLMAARHSIGQFTAFVGFTFGNSVSDEHTDSVSFQSYCGTANNRHLADRLDILPVHYSQLPAILGKRKPVVLLSLSEGDTLGHYSFGPSADYVADLLDSARLVIAEVSSKGPRTGTGTEVSKDQIDILIHTDTPLLSPSTAQPTETEAKISQLIAGIVEDGSTLQIGLGSLPVAILNALKNHNDLGFHSGVFVKEVADMIDEGIITNARKTIDTGHSIAGILTGDQSLMDWTKTQNKLLLRPVSYTHNVNVLASIDKFVALNSAIEVDLSGQVNAEVANGRYLGAVGGAPAFLRGAAQSNGGLGIVALPSTAKGKSRIVSTLSGPVSSARSDVSFIVTEYGIADLRGASIAERRQKMLAITHPDHVTGIEAGLP